MERHALARFLIVCTLMLCAAEFLTKRTPATLRWSILALTWCVLVMILFWVTAT